MVDEKVRTQLIKALQNAVYREIDIQNADHSTVTSALYSTLASWIALLREDHARREMVQVIQYGLPIDVEKSNSLLPEIKEDNVGNPVGTA